MPVGTRAEVRGILPTELRELGSHIVLANTYHLWMGVGHERIKRLGGLHKFMGWDGPILTDSGGFQVFSLKERTKVTENGVSFRTKGGDKLLLTPEKAVEIQEAFGVDIAMAFDECIEFPATLERTKRSTERTTRWLKRCLDAREHADRTALFGIVQGGTFPELRAAHAQELAEMDLDGYAIGGLSVGEGHQAMCDMVSVSAPHLPSDRPRYLMGVGHPVDIAEAVARGVDMFDCVLPTRAGRHGQAYTSVGRVNMRNARYKDADEPLDPNCDCMVCETFSRAYLCHVTRTNELLGKRLITHHNLHYYQRLMARLRAAILAGDEAQFQALRDEAATASVSPGGNRVGAQKSGS